MKKTSTSTWVMEPELKMKVTKTKASGTMVVKRSACAATAFRNFYYQKDQSINWIESFMILCLSRSNKVIGLCQISVGGVGATVVDAKVVFQIALNANASCGEGSGYPGS